MVAAEEICISTIDNIRGQCDNRTNVRILRGDVDMENGREVITEQDACEYVAEWLRHATTEQKQKYLEMLKSFQAPEA